MRSDQPPDTTAGDTADTTLVIPPLASAGALAQHASDRAAHYAAQAFAPATHRAYRSDWADWQRWCAPAGFLPVPATPEAVAAYLAQLADRKSVATVTRRLAALSTAHRLAGHRLDTGHPSIRAVLRGLRREHGIAPRRARAATTAVIRDLLATCDDSPLGIRDRALLLLGFAAALRRSELAALTIDDLEFTPEGVRLHIRRSKTDAEGAGASVGVVATGSATCPVAALRVWLEAAPITEGRVFRRLTRHRRLGVSLTGEAVALVVQRRAALAGLDPAGWSAHSLRAGLATAAAAAGVAELDIQRQTRHRSVAVLRGYVRHGSLFRNNASGAVGL